jgi:hypothetical protein
MGCHYGNPFSFTPFFIELVFVLVMDIRKIKLRKEYLNDETLNKLFEVSRRIINEESVLTFYVRNDDMKALTGFFMQNAKVFV